MQHAASPRISNQFAGIVLLGVLAAAFSLWSLDHVVKSAAIYLQGSLFLFFMLVLGQRSRIVAYALLPAILCGWFSYDGLYDVAGGILHDNCLHAPLTTAAFHQHYLRLTYDIPVAAVLLILLKGGLIYGAIYATRRHLAPITLFTANGTWLIAGAYIILSLVLLPLGIFTHFTS
ncbi:MAG: hypothetical protein J6R92_04020 [Akkermansia sp.]|jgi:hypothetical protein|nr:hypothetical protein [Akkermansia sp.]